MDALDEVVPAVVDVAVGPPLPEPLLLMEPVYDIGIQRVDVAPTGKSVCPHCGGKLAKDSARLVYHPAKSVFRFMHAGCCASVPDGIVPHSRATLTQQHDVAAGAHVLAVRDAIDVALGLL